ncbi:MAG: S8 family serine peptidase [Planctomycetes bacterium]|nr:S8 family serine peptidase [Planctomycetota bacterium]
MSYRAARSILIPGLGLVLAAFAVPTTAQQPVEPAAAEPAPCDPALLATDGPHPVFVRMHDQRFARGGEFEASCAAAAHTPRSKLRREAIADLRRRAEQSWADVATAVGELETGGELREVQRFWIVNGFAADASKVAVERLRRLPTVAFVHVQTQRGGKQHRTQARSAAWREARADDERTARAMLERRGDEGEFDAAGLTVPWNLQAVHADRAWALGATGQGVTVALLDSGLLATEPVAHALWQNPSERPNGIDDDGNGFVDDLYGWDFAGDTRFVVGDGARSHGTMCGGIVAGRPWGEPRTVTGVAPRARLMVLRGMGSLRAYEYAAAMGADVLSMSYMWIDIELGSYRGVFRTAHEHLAACGVVAVGGAGNFGQSSPAGRQIALPKDIPCVIAASGIDATRAAPAFSSRGPCTWNDVPFFADYPPEAPLRKPDVAGCAAGFPVWHRAKFSGRSVEVLWQDAAGYGLIQGPRGNSFSGPHAAGVAALVLSVRPELTAWRVKALLEATCADLGDEGRDPVYGAGLLQADAAVRAAKAALIDE